MVYIKVVHKDNVRKFTLTAEASWIELEAKLRTLFSIPALTPFTLSYTDEDNDVITLSTDIELHEILSTSPNIKFNLKFSSPDDFSDSEDSNSEVWVLEGRGVSPSKKDVSVVANETDNSGLQDNVPPKNIISTTNQEPQCETSSNISQEPPQYIENDKNVTSLNKKPQTNLMDDDFERVEARRSSTDLGKLENPLNDAEKSSNDLEKSEKSSNDLKRVERLSNDFERTERSPTNFERKERSSVDLERSPVEFRRTEKSNDIERTERSSPIDFRKTEKSSNDFERTERSSDKKPSLVNLLDDEFFDSLSSPFNITSTIASSAPSASSKPKPIPQPKPRSRYEFNIEENSKETVLETSTSSDSSFFSVSEQNQQQRPRQSQNQNTKEPHVVEQFKDMIDQYENLIKEDPQLVASIKDTMDQIRSSIPGEHPAEQDLFRRQNTQSRGNKRNLRQQRSVTPPAYTRSPTPPRHGYRSSTPPIPGSFPTTPPLPATPCLWINNEPNPNQNPRRGGRGGRRGGPRGRYHRNNNNQKNRGEVTPEREATPERSGTPERSASPEPNTPFYNEIKFLNDMGYNKHKDEYMELLQNYEGDIESVVDELIRRENRH